jgi:hypothetical protein
MNSPILGAYEQQPPRAISVLDQDFEMMGLSRYNAAMDNESYFMEALSMDPIDDLNLDFVKDNDRELPF